MAKTTIEIDVKTGDSAKSLSDLRGEFKDIQKELSGLTPGTEKYIDALKRLGAVKDEIGDLKDEINAFAGADKKIAAVSNVIGGIANGFQAAQGAAALFGADNEALNETMVKLQATMALTQGIQGLAGMGDGLKAVGNLLKSTTLGTQAAAAAQRIYNAVMAANPIGLIVAGLTALVGVIALVVNAMKDEDEAQKNVIAGREREIEVMRDQNAALQREADFRKNLAAAQGKSAEEQLAIDKELGDAKKKRINDEIAALSKNIRERTALIRNADEDERKEIQDKNQKDVDARKALYNELYKIDSDYTINRTKLNTENSKKEDERQKAADAKAKENAKKKIDDDIANAEKWRQEQAKFIQYEIDALNNKFDETEQIIAEQQLATKIALNTATPQEIEAWNAYNLQKQQEYNNAVDAELKRLKAIEDKRRADEDAKIAAEYALRLEGFKQLELQKVEWAKQGLTLISELNTLFSGQSEAQQKRAFEIDKAVKLSSATISGIEGTMNAYSTAQKSPITAVFPAYPAIQAGLAAAFAAVNIAKIAKTKFGGTEKATAPSGGGSLGTFSQGGGGGQPPQGLTSQNTVTQLNPDGTVAGQGNREAAPMKAYVVESESRAVTERVNKLSNNSKIG
jgi:hypothetical protein